MTLALRPATPRDVLTVFDITRQAFAEYHGRLDPPSGADGETLDDVAQALAQGWATMALLDGAPVGSVRFRREPDGVYVGRLAVLPRARRQGVGAALLQSVEDSASALGARRLRLRVRLGLPGNVRLYLRLGYRAVAIHPRGQREAALTMVKDLGASPDSAETLLPPLLPDLYKLEAEVRAVLLFGSYARGSAGPFSDIDLGLLTAATPAVPDRLRLLDRPQGRLPLSIHARSLGDILQEATDPCAWPELTDIYGEARLLHGSAAALAEVRERLEELRPTAEDLWAGAEHDILALLEAAGKAKNAAAALDAVGLLASTTALTAACARLLRPLNPPWRSLRTARLPEVFARWSAAPVGAAEDAALCLGACFADDRLAWALRSALHLGAGTLAELRGAASALPLSADLRAALADGSLLGLLEQEGGEAAAPPAE